VKTQIINGCFLTLALTFPLTGEPLDQPKVFTPYQPDEHTLHLWSLDEPGPPFKNQADTQSPLRGMFNGAKPKQASLPGLGSSVSLNANVGGSLGASDLQGAILTESSALHQNEKDNAPKHFQYFGQDGAFTYELIVKFDILPQDAPTIALGLLSMEGDGPDRAFNFRIEKEGFLSFTPLPDVGASGGGIASIPTSGPHGIDTQSWFHIAVSYDGNAGVANNLKLYWTRITGTLNTANRIGSGTLSNDLNGILGDFAVGNEARSFPENAEAEPFLGNIDQVRISGVARHPSDFFFTPTALRKPPTPTPTDQAPPRTPTFKLEFSNLMVDSKPTPFPHGNQPTLKLPSGLHRFDFDFGFRDLTPNGEIEPFGLASDSRPTNVRMRSQLLGIDERWQESELGMSLIFHALDTQDNVIGQSLFSITNRSPGWETTLEDSSMTRRVEPVYIPAGTEKIRLILSSGSPDTTGFFAIDYVGLHPPERSTTSLLDNGVLAYDANTTSIAGTPSGWRRGGTDQAIARLSMRTARPGLALVDGEQNKYGEWITSLDLHPSAPRDATYSISWYGAHNVIGGSTHRANYVNVPPGSYTFRIIGLAENGDSIADQISLRIEISQPIWQLFWFWPIITATCVALVASIIFAIHRNRAQRSMEKLRFQNAIESDRTRIARDMHDDLGSRVTFINMSAALAQRDIERAPDNARRHLAKISDSARDLVVAMDGLVWAVDPTHDTLDHLASHLTRLAEKMFADTPIRCRLDIPPLLPPLPLGSEFRHHIALAVKESFHNILRHAGPCEVYFSLRFNGQNIDITIRDTGAGFDPVTVTRGQGLDNFNSRCREIGAICRIVSSPGSGTSIILSCPVHEDIQTHSNDA
jgi:signal transduction histidine kinase